MTAAEIRALTSVLRVRTSAANARDMTSVLELSGAITRGTAALTQGRPSGVGTTVWNAFFAALRAAMNARAIVARATTLAPSPFESEGEPDYVFTEEEVGITQAPAPQPAQQPSAQPTAVQQIAQWLNVSPSEGPKRRTSDPNATLNRAATIASILAIAGAAAVVGLKVTGVL